MEIYRLSITMEKSRKGERELTGNFMVTSSGDPRILDCDFRLTGA